MVNQEVDIDELRKEMDEMDEDLEEDEGLEDEISLPIRNPKGAGRKKGSKSKKNIEIGANQDPFEYAIQYTQAKCEPVSLRIFRSGAFLAEINFASDPSKIKFKSISDVQRILGAGIYVFKLYSITSRQLICETSMQILDIPAELANDVVSQPQESDALSKALDGLTNYRVSEPQQTDRPINVHVPTPKSGAQAMQEWIPIIAALSPLLKEILGSKKQPDNQMELMRMERELREKHEEKLDKERQRLRDEAEAERRRIREDEERFDRKLADKLEEKASMMGLSPEKSTLEEVADIVKSFSGMVKTRGEVAKALAVKKQQLVKKPVKQIAASNTAKPIIISDPKDYDDDMILDEILGLLSQGTTESSDISTYIKSKPDLLASIKKSNAETISLKAKDKLQLSDETFEVIKKYIVEVYDNL